MAVALVVAAGRGERLGTPVPKAFVNLAGRPMVAYVVDAGREVDVGDLANDVRGMIDVHR